MPKELQASLPVKAGPSDWEKTDSQVAGRDLQDVSSEADLVVIGAGPVGLAFAQRYLSKSHLPASLMLFGDEPYAPYDRVQLSALLAGEKSTRDLLLKMPVEKHGVEKGFQYVNRRIARINVREQWVADASGSRTTYGRLVLATGSRPFVPDIPGTDLAGVLVFRSLRDTEQLAARRVRARHVVVVGGGLLGVEAARAIRRFATRVTLVQQGETLMNRQLSAPCAEQLAAHVKEQNIGIILNQGVRGIQGRGVVESIVLRDGHRMTCDTVIFCAGIIPNTSLAAAAGIATRHGIVVDDRLQTSADNVYAIGECSEHQGKVYGLVAPGIEQAGVLADRLAQQAKALYPGSQAVSHLKVMATPVCSMGQIGDLPSGLRYRALTYRNFEKGIARTLQFDRGRLIGACGVGDWPESRRLQHVIADKARLWPWQKLRFRHKGECWGAESGSDVRNWPAQTPLCQCRQVSLGNIQAAVDSGCKSLDAIAARTGAGSACGTCQPLIAQLLEAPVTASLSSSVPLLALSSLVALMFLAGFLAIGGIASPDTVQGLAYDITWTSSFWKQVTGFSLVGLTVFGLMIGIRKRWTKFPGSAATWRVVHTVLGCLLLLGLVLHTGTHLGDNFNRILLIDFLLVCFLGAAVGLATARQGKRASPASRRQRDFWYWAHVLVVWPLPVLILTHVFTVYYF